MEKKLTEGSVFGNMLLFSLPYLLSYFLQTLYGMADLYIIGAFEGVASTTAVAVGSQIMHMLTVMLVGLAMGTTVTVGRAIGAGNRKEAGKSIGNTLTLFLSLSVVLAFGLFFSAGPIVSLMSTPAEAVEGTKAYLRVCFVGIPFITAYNIISAIFRGLGDSKSPMYFIAFACFANIGLDYLFIGAFRMGPSGAALGTTLAQALSVLFALLAVRKKKLGIPLKKSDLCPEKKTFGALLGIGVPIAAQDGLIQIAFLFITVIVNRRGLYDAAAVGIVEKIISFLFLVPSSMLSAVSALGAQNIGAGKPRRAEQTLGYAVLVSALFGLTVALVAQFASPWAVSLFTDRAAEGGPEVIRLGASYLRGYAWDCLFAGIHFSFSGYFCATGRSYLSFLHNITAILLARLPGVYFTSILFLDTLLPMGLATASGSLLSVLVCLVAFALFKRKDGNLSGQMHP